MEKLTKYDLLKYSQTYHNNHGITEGDVEKANFLKTVIEQTRDKTKPKNGDIAIVSGPKKTYKNGHIQREKINGFAAICVRPYKPFVSVNKDCNGNWEVHTNSSGGYWFGVPDEDYNSALKMFTYVGKRQKLFKDWGHCGACGNGAFTFMAEVYVWELFLENIY